MTSLFMAKQQLHVDSLVALPPWQALAPSFSLWHAAEKESALDESKTAFFSQYL